MWPIVGRVGNMEVSWFGLGMAILFWVVSFWWWKRMKSDYDEEAILMGTVVVWVAGVVGGVIDYWLWNRGWGVAMYGSVLGGAFGVWLWARLRKWNLWEFSDVVFSSVFAVMTLGSLAWGPGQMVRAGFAAVALFLMEVLRKNFRKFTWYKSGKLGFVTLTTIIVWSVLEIVVAFFVKQRVYFLGLALNQWLAIVIILLTSVGLYVRSGREISEDLNKLWIKKPKNKISQ